MRSPKELIELYWTEVWNNRNVEMMRELCADPIIRHDPGSVTALSLEDQMARVRQQSETMQPYFEHEVLHADDSYVTSVWNMWTRVETPVHLCGIEVFKAENGRFTHCWNSSYTPGRWGREGDPAIPAHLPPPGLIASPDQVTPAWLQAVFQHAGVEAPRVSMAGSSPIGHGNLSETVRTVITYNANAEKTVNSVICKLTAAASGAVDVAQSQGAYLREAEVYRFLGNQPAFRTPRCFWSAAGADGRSINLVLEDLSGRTRAGDQITGCSVADAGAVVDELARLHVTAWQDPRLDQAGWLLQRAAWAEALEDVYGRGAALIRERLADQVSTGDLADMDRFAPLVADLTRAVPAGPTLIHGEPRVDNILFEDAPDGPRAWLIDWQFADRGSPMFDTAYFLAGSLTVEDRRLCEQDLIARHQQAIAAVAPAFGPEQALRQYDQSLPFALFTTVGAATAMPAGEHENRLLATLLQRNLAALRDRGLIPA